MLDVVSNEDLQGLIEVESPGRCVSFCLPTHDTGPRVSEGPIRLKNLIADAKKEFDRVGVRSSEAAQLLSPVKALVDDPAFWSHAEAGLLVFVNPDGLRRFRLPGPVDAAVMVGDRFWIAPLMPFVASDARFFVLTLSENEVRLLRCGQHHVGEVDLGEIPASLADALRFDDRESQLQSHGADRVGSGQVSATFHGQGVGSDFDNADLERFLQAVDRGLDQILGDRSDPVVLAGVDEIVARFRKLSRRRNFAEESIAGNPEALSPTELHERSVQLVASHLVADQLQARERYDSRSAPTTESVAEVIEAATAGRVASVFVRSGYPVWGSVGSGNRIDEHSDRGPGDVDLVDLVARATFEHGGQVYAVDASEMPSDEPVAAVLRY